jgi:hypothetical protein
MDNLTADDLHRNLHSTDDQEQLLAVIALDKIGGRDAQEAVSDVAPLMSSENELIREQAAIFLGKHAPIADEHICQLLLTLLEDSADYVRQEAAAALGLLHYTPALLGLTKLARRDASWLVRVEAIEALDRFRDPALFSLYQDVLMQDEDADVKRYAASAMADIAQPEHIMVIARDIQALQEHPKVVARLMLALYRLDAAGSLEQFFELLQRVNDFDEIRYILESLERAMRGRLPHHIHADLPRIAAQVDDLSVRMPETRSWRDALLEQIRQIQEGQILPESDCC